MPKRAITADTVVIIDGPVDYSEFLIRERGTVGSQ